MIRGAGIEVDVLALLSLDGNALFGYCITLQDGWIWGYNVSFRYIGFFGRVLAALPTFKQIPHEGHNPCNS